MVGPLRLSDYNNYHPGLARAEINKETLFECSSPRKSLVKGERFMRYEENSEISKNGLTGIYKDGRHKSLHQCKLIDLKFSVKYFLLNRMFFCFIYSMQIKTTKCIFCMIIAKKIDS